MISLTTTTGKLLTDKTFVYQKSAAKAANVMIQNGVRKNVQLRDSTTNKVLQKISI